jgi:hypothetical protein
MDTIQFIRNSLEDSKGNWPQICEETGIDYSWLTKFAQGLIPNPGYRKVDALAMHFGVVCAVSPAPTFKDVA